MPTRKALISFGHLPDAAALELLLAILYALRDNPRYRNPSPSLEVVAAIAHDFQQALEAAHHGAPAQTAVKNQQRALLNKTLHDLGNYVNSVADGDLVALESSGFPLSKPPSPVGVLPAPRDLQLGDGGVGAISVSFQPVPGARAYLIQRAEGELPQDASGWTETLETKSRFTQRGLTSGVRYWFRVAAIGTGSTQAQTYPFSDAASRYAQ